MAITRTARRSMAYSMPQNAPRSKGPYEDTKAKTSETQIWLKTDTHNARTDGHAHSSPTTDPSPDPSRRQRRKGAVWLSVQPCSARPQTRRQRMHPRPAAWEQLFPQRGPSTGAPRAHARGAPVMGPPGPHRPSKHILPPAPPLQEPPPLGRSPTPAAAPADEPSMRGWGGAPPAARVTLGLMMTQRRSHGALVARLVAGRAILALPAVAATLPPAVAPTAAAAVALRIQRNAGRSGERGEELGEPLCCCHGVGGNPRLGSASGLLPHDAPHACSRQGLRPAPPPSSPRPAHEPAHGWCGCATATSCPEFRPNFGPPALPPPPPLPPSRPPALPPKHQQKTRL